MSTALMLKAAVGQQGGIANVDLTISRTCTVTLRKYLLKAKEYFDTRPIRQQTFALS